MTADPLTTTALLGAARMSAMPPPPDPSLEPAWKNLDRENPAAAVLQGLALVRALRRAGAKSRLFPDVSPPSPPETRAFLPAAAVDLALRILAGEFAEVLPEWLRLATASGRLLPARVLPDLLSAATKNPALAAAVPALAGERGFWLARRHPEFSWLLETAAVGESAWETGSPAERIAWLRQTRAADPAAAASVIAAHWAGEDAPMRTAILRLAADRPQACDEAWLETLALKDPRREIRELAAVSLMEIPGSAFRARAIRRVRGCVKITRRLLRRVIAVEPPAAFDPAWTADGLVERPPQGTGEKAWWLRQIVSQLPPADWPGLLDCPAADLFALPIESDWQDAVLLGWLDSARRLPRRALAGQLVPFFAKLNPWPAALPRREAVLSELLDPIPAADRFRLLDFLAGVLEPSALLDLLARCGEPPPAGAGSAALAVLDAAIPAIFRGMNRPQARALAICIPPEEIQLRLETLAKLPGLPTAAEEFATTLEFRKSMISHFKTP